METSIFSSLGSTIFLSVVGPSHPVVVLLRVAQAGRRRTTNDDRRRESQRRRPTCPTWCRVPSQHARHVSGIRISRHVDALGGRVETQFLARPCAQRFCIAGFQSRPATARRCISLRSVSRRLSSLPGTPRPLDSLSIVLRNFESIFQTTQLVRIDITRYVLTFMVQPILDRVYHQLPILLHVVLEGAVSLL